MNTAETAMWSTRSNIQGKLADFRSLTCTVRKKVVVGSSAEVGSWSFPHVVSHRARLMATARLGVPLSRIAWIACAERHLSIRCTHHPRLLSLPLVSPTGPFIKLRSSSTAHTSRGIHGTFDEFISAGGGGADARSLVAYCFSVSDDFRFASAQRALTQAYSVPSRQLFACACQASCWQQPISKACGQVTAVRCGPGRFAVNTDWEFGFAERGPGKH